MNKEKYFLSQVEKFIKLLKIDKEIVVRKDNRLGKNYCAGIRIMRWCDTEKLVYQFRYNTKKFEELTRLEIVNMILHELGHVILNHELSDEALIKMEYDAEKYAINTIKRYLPQHYNKAVNYLKEYINHENKIYRKAFSKLYKELTSEKVTK